MIGWILYDISDNKIRNRISAVCKDYGFVRYQKSVFCGDTDERILKVLVARITDEISPSEEKEDSVLVFTVCDSCMKNRLEVGRKIDPDKIKRPRLIIIG
jgi:CRISPR-associated protein Cas2